MSLLITALHPSSPTLQPIEHSSIPVRLILQLFFRETAHPAQNLVFQPLSTQPPMHPRCPGGSRKSPRLPNFIDDLLLLVASSRFLYSVTILPRLQRHTFSYYVISLSKTNKAMPIIYRHGVPRFARRCHIQCRSPRSGTNLKQNELLPSLR